MMMVITMEISAISLVDMRLSLVAITSAVSKLKLREFVPDKLFINNIPKYMDEYVRLDFLDDNKSSAPLMRLPFVLAEKFNLWLLPMKHDLEKWDWIVSIMDESIGYGSILRKTTRGFDDES